MVTRWFLIGLGPSLGRKYSRRAISAAAFSRHRVRTLCLDVKMFLTVLLSAALKYVLAGLERIRCVAKYELLWRDDEAPVCGRDTRIEHRSERVDVSLD